jgi:transposase
MRKRRQCHDARGLEPSKGVGGRKQESPKSYESVWMWATVVTVWRWGYRAVRCSKSLRSITGSRVFKSSFLASRSTARQENCPVAVAMEGYNGYARPLDSMVRERGYRLYNLNNLKFARFKEIFPGAAKSDRIDARKGLELFQLRDHLPLAKEVLQEVSGTPADNEILKRLTRRRRRLVNERVRVVNNLQARTCRRYVLAC